MEFFGTLSREWALECMKDLLLVNLRGNLQIIVQVSSTLDDNISFVSSISNSYTIKHDVCRLPKNIPSSWVRMLALNSLSNSSPMRGFTFSWDLT